FRRGSDRRNLPTVLVVVLDHCIESGHAWPDRLGRLLLTLLVLAVVEEAGQLPLAKRLRNLTDEDNRAYEAIDHGPGVATVYHQLVGLL
ncbi:hypothetical protein V2A32_33565, partial [Pseudomonas aeruginosa]